MIFSPRAAQKDRDQSSGKPRRLRAFFHTIFCGTVILLAGLYTPGCQVEAPSGNGTFTIKGLPPEYEGQFALFATGNSLVIDGKEAWVLGASSFTPSGNITGTAISGGTAMLPAWAMPDDNEKYRPERLDGNDTMTFQYAMVYINQRQVNTDDGWWDSPVQLLVHSVSFINGAASVDKWTVYTAENGALSLPFPRKQR